MIHPSASMSPSGARTNLRWWFAYYFAALAIGAANFLPMLVDSPARNQSLTAKTVNYLIVCNLLSLPLLFEFFFDVVVSLFSSSSLSEPRVGYFMLLLSMFLPVVTVSGNLDDSDSPCSILFINCFSSFLQALVIIGQYDKLQFRTKGHWRVGGCLSVLFLFVVSQICLNLGVAYSPVDYDNHLDHLTLRLKWCLSCGVVSGALCLFVHCCLSKKYLYEFVISYLRHSNAIDVTHKWRVDDFVAMALQCISSTYFLFNCLGCILFLMKDYNFNHHVNSAVVTHIVLGLCAAILPGRVVRKNFMLLNEKMAIKETFIRYVSHEIRSPLSTTSLGLNFLLDKLRANEINLSEVLDVVQESVVTCELAMDTLNDFLMLDKIQSNMLELQTSTRKASEFMMEAIRPFSLQASSANVNLSCSVETCDGVACRDASIDMDGYKMNQVLRNLLSNAFKFTPSGGSITVSMAIQEYSVEELVRVNGKRAHTQRQCANGFYNMVRYEVTDSGCGISAENLPRLFGQYVQFDAAKLQGGKGSGLGLWLSKAIVEMHGGRMGATSEGEGKGCTFWFELPCMLERELPTVTMHSAGTHTRKTFVISCSNNQLKSATHTPVEDIECGGVGGCATNKALLSAVNDLRHCVMHKMSPLAIIDTSGGSKATPRSNKMFVDLPMGSSIYSKAADRYKSSPVAMDGNSRWSAETPLKVLLVDDSAITRKMVERSLHSIDAVCTHARNGREAVEKVQLSMELGDGCGYDVILMDHQMPEMSGPEAVEVIRGGGVNYKGAIIAVTGNASTDTEFEVLLTLGKVNMVMIKPFNLEAFVDFMGNWKAREN